MKLLSICIPTYKRPITLRRCIISVVEQIQRYGLEEQVMVYVTNDASPDNTAQVLDEFKPLSFYKHVNRDKNLGMSANIKSMLEEALQESTFQLIITDDDYLQPDTLDSLVKYLAAHLAENPDAPLIWTPRYSYTEDGNLQSIACKPFQIDTLIPPSTENAGRYMFNGFVLSGLILKSREIDFSLWNEHLENAYFPVIFSGDLILRQPSYFWNKNIIHHSVLNECHWERWGQTDAEINLRLFIDFMNAYEVIANKIRSALQTFLFYVFAFPSILQFIDGILISNGGFARLGEREVTALLGIDRVSFSKINTPSKIIFFIAAFRIMSACLFRMAKYKIMLNISIDRKKRERRYVAFNQNAHQLANALFLMRWAR